MNLLLAALFVVALAGTGAIARSEPVRVTAAAATPTPVVAAASKTPEKKAEKRPRGKAKKAGKPGGAASGAK